MYDMSMSIRFIYKYADKIREKKSFAITISTKNASTTTTTKTKNGLIYFSYPSHDIRHTIVVSIEIDSTKWKNIEVLAKCNRQDWKNNHLTTIHIEN